MKYSQITKQIYKENSAIFIKYWWALLGLSILYHTYQYLIFKFVKVSAEHLSIVMSVYHVVTYPVIILVIMYLVDCYNKKHLPKDFSKLITDTKRCYLRIICIYLVIAFFGRNFGFGATLVIFVVMYIKLPFLEQEIFFKNSSLWKAIKNTNARTNEEDIMKVITVLIVMFLVIYFGIEKINRIAVGSDVIYKRTILLSISVIKLTFFFFCKAVLTKVYTNIK
mgnify:CR=1 FL=1|jgi:hypothetical protein